MSQFRFEDSLLLSELAIDPQTLIQAVPSYQRNQYIAALNRLTACEEQVLSFPAQAASCAKACHHLADVGAWQLIDRVLLTPLTAMQSKTLDEIIRAWRLREDGVTIYSVLVDKLDPRTDAICWRGLAECYSAQQPPEIVCSLYEKSRTAFLTLNEHAEAADILHRLGAYFAHHKGDYLNAKTYYLQALAEYQALENDERLASLYADLAYDEDEQGCTIAAVQYMQKSLDIQEKLAVTGVEATYVALYWAQFAFGRLLTKQGAYKAAQSYLRQAIHSFTALNLRDGIGWGLFAWAILLAYQEKYQAAHYLLCYIHNMQTSIEFGRPLEAWVHHLLGRIALKLEDYDSARTHFLAMLRSPEFMAHQAGVTYAIHGLACVAAHKNQLECSAYLFSAVVAIQAQLNHVMPTFDAVDGEQALAIVRAKLDALTLETIQAAGQAAISNGIGLNQFYNIVDYETVPQYV